MELRLSCADFAFPLLPHDDALNLISMLQFEGVDIGLFEGSSHLWPSREFLNPGRSANQLKEKLDDLGLCVADIFLITEDNAGCAINHPEIEVRQEVRDLFLRTLDYTAECDCRHVTILPGVKFDDESVDKAFGRTVDELVWRVGEARKYDIVLGVEAHIGSIVPDPESAGYLVRKVSGLTLTLDYTHFTRDGVPDSEVEHLVESASHLHARGGREGRLQESFVRNTIDYARVVEVMQATAYDGWIGIEYAWTEWERCNENDNLSDTIRFREFFRSLIPN